MGGFTLVLILFIYPDAKPNPSQGKLSGTFALVVVESCFQAGSKGASFRRPALQLTSIHVYIADERTVLSTQPTVKGHDSERT